MASPPISLTAKPGSLSNYLPLNEDSLPTTLTQQVPDLLQQRPFLQWGFRRGSYARSVDDTERGPRDERQPSRVAETLMTPQVRSMRLIGSSNPRYQWEKYYTGPEKLKTMKKATRQYYERNNALIGRYLYIDRLLDSDLPHVLIEDYNRPSNGALVDIPQTIVEEPSPVQASESSSQEDSPSSPQDHGNAQTRLKRTPKNLYRLPDEQTPLMGGDGPIPELYSAEDENVDGSSGIVKLALVINAIVNGLLFLGKAYVSYVSASVSVLASLIDAALDLLSSLIFWATSWLAGRSDKQNYPIGRRTLEPIGVLVFSVIMMTSFAQVAIESIKRLASSDHRVVTLSTPAIAIMGSTVGSKALLWVWCRLIKNSSAQAIAQDAESDVIFNTFSIIFPLIGHMCNIWWLDAAGGILLSAFIIYRWSETSLLHIRNLTGAAASSDQRNVLLYLTMRFAKTIRSIQGIQVYHVGDKLNVEVDIVLDENMSLKDSHDLSETLQYVLESVPAVERAFVHADYNALNLPTHMDQHE